MKIGMMWLDADTKRTFEEKVNRAAEYYQQKHGRLPELCLVNKKMGGVKSHVGNIEIQTVNTVLPYHFWLGLEMN